RSCASEYAGRSAAGWSRGSTPHPIPSTTLPTAIRRLMYAPPEQAPPIHLSYQLRAADWRRFAERHCNLGVHAVAAAFTSGSPVDEQATGRERPSSRERLAQPGISAAPKQQAQQVEPVVLREVGRLADPGSLGGLERLTQQAGHRERHRAIRRIAGSLDRHGRE